ncbi:MAG: sulfotransferase family protein [Bacteroidota bacterium]
MKNITPIFLIGAMKSGTSSIYKHLELHPEICFSPLKEPEYFSVKMGKAVYKEGDFWDLFDLKPQHNFVFDGSTGYTKYPAENGVAKRIFEYGLKPKFIYIVRNPYDRIVSHYNFMQKNLKWNNSITSNHLINVSNYYLQLCEYEKYFKREDILVVDFDDLKSDYKSLLKRIYDFIGVKEYVFADQNIKNNITKPVNRKELKLKKKLGGKFNFIPKSIRKLVKQLISKSMRKDKRKLTANEREYIFSKLNNDMILFQESYSFSVSKWGFGK